MALLALAATWAYLWIGYRCYLQIPRGWGSAAMSLVLGFLLARMAVLFL